MTTDKVICVTQDGDVTITVSNRKTYTGIAGQRMVSVDVHYEGISWSEDVMNSYVHSTYGGPVIAVLSNDAQIFVTDPEQYGDTSKLDDSWFRRFYSRGEQT